METAPDMSQLSTAQKCAIESAAKLNRHDSVRVVLPLGSKVELPAYLEQKYGDRIAKESLDFANDVIKVKSYVLD